MRFSFQRGNIVQLLLIGIIYFGAVFIFPSFLPKTMDVNLRLYITMGFSAIATVLILGISFKYKNDIERGEQKYNLITKIAIGLAGFLAIMILQGLVNGLLQYLSRIFDFQANSQNTSNVVEIIKLNPLFICYVVLLGPMLEELFFRKAVFGYFYDVMLGSKGWIRFTIPALITGVIFALPHDGVSPIMVIYIVMSFVFSFLYLKTKSILTPMISHIIMNGLVVIVQLSIH